VIICDRPLKAVAKSNAKRISIALPLCDRATIRCEPVEDSDKLRFTSSLFLKVYLMRLGFELKPSRLLYMDNIRRTTILLVLSNPFGTGYFTNRIAIGSEMTLVFAIYQSFPAASFKGLLSLCLDIQGLR
jgi:hypothetical protein